MSDIFEKEFTINSLKNTTFRPCKMSPVETLAITTQIDFSNFKATKELINFCLEHTEVNVGGVWLKVKTEGREVYAPHGIENDILALNEIFTYIMTEVIGKLFQKSNE